MSFSLRRFLVYLSLVTVSSLFGACEESKKEAIKENTQTTKNTEKPLLPAPQFSADSAYKFVEEQVAFGPRFPNSEAHQKTGDYIIAKLQDYDRLEVNIQNFTAQAFDGTTLKGRNIMASLNPSIKKRILLAAHWDTRPFADQDTDEERHNEPILGANDGGSGVGVLLEIARLLSVSSEQPQAGIDLIFFDLEDYGTNAPNTYCLGSQYWGKNKMPENYTAYYGILLDMVGAEGATFAKEGFSMQVAPSVVDKVWKMAHKIGYGTYFSFEEAPSITDDHYYVSTLGKIPMIDIIEYSTQGKGYFGPYWHTHDDNMDIISKTTLKAVGQTVVHTIYNEENKAK